MKTGKRSRVVGCPDLEGASAVPALPVVAASGLPERLLALTAPDVPENASPRPGSKDPSTLETSTFPALPLTTANISIYQQGVLRVEERPPQNSGALTEEKAAISTSGPTIRLEDHTQTSRVYESHSNASYDRQADPGQSQADTTLCNDRVTPFRSLTVDISFEERPPLARSSSLEVHAPSPTPLEEQLESPTALASVGLESSHGHGAPLMTEESSLPIQSLTARNSFSETTSETSSFVILTPQISSTESKASSTPAPPLSPWQQIRTPAGFLTTPHLVTIEEALDDQLHQPFPTLDHMTRRQAIIPESGGIVRELGPPPLPVSTYGSHTIERPRPPRIDAPKYPPCWTTDEGLLIVPSVPGELVKDRTEQIKSGNDELVETTSSTNAKHERLLNKGDAADDLVTVAALSPNVTAYRKGRCPRRKRSPSYYDPDIFPRQRINHVN